MKAGISITAPTTALEINCTIKLNHSALEVQRFELKNEILKNVIASEAKQFHRKIAERLLRLP